MRIGTALNCEIRPSRFDRKNYFYPDMPKDYQIISVRRADQRRRPSRPAGRDTRRDRARPHRRGHREDHPRRRRRTDPRRRLLTRRLQPGRGPSCRDRLRARHPQRGAGATLRVRAARRSSSRRGLLTVAWRRARCGSTPTSRCDGSGTSELGTRCEVKNLNSLRSLGRAIDYEIERQTEIVSVGRIRRAADASLGRAERVDRRARPRRRRSTTGTSPSPTSFPSIPIRPGCRRSRARSARCPQSAGATVEDALGARGRPAQSDQIVTVVDLGLDPLVLSAVAAGIDPGLALRRTANEAAQRPS